MVKLGIIADDLTGAMDTGAQFARCGLDTVVMLTGDRLPEAEALAISTDSRSETAAEAYRRARKAADQLGGRLIYKKIDSTMRGNVGAELDGVMECRGIDRALVAPAFPEAGRTTVGGVHYVDGVPLAGSPVGRDPFAPVRESRLTDLLTGQTRRKVGHLPLRTVEQGDQAVLQALGVETAAVVVADAAERRHLRTLGRALAHMVGQWLPCGSAGLAAEWPLALGLEQARQVLKWWPRADPVLVVAGSRHPKTEAQLRQAEADSYLVCVTVDLGTDLEETVRAHVLPVLRAGRNVALTATCTAFQEGGEAAFATALGLACQRVLKQVTLSGMVITGGDVLGAVCRALEASALRLAREVQPGVPAGTWIGGLGDGQRVVTKAGGLGDERAIAQAIHSIQGGFA
jgi:uncharacterized protein YgbK (DUF1537 family)